MRSLRLFVIACALGAAGLQAADREFKDIVRAISDEYHTQPMRLWGLGFVAKAALPFTGTGVSGTDFAIFEDLGARSGSTAQLAQRIQSLVGHSWKPFVRVQSPKSGEITLVYFRQDGKDPKLLITTIERDDAVVLQCKLNPERLRQWIDEPRESAANKNGHARREAEDDDDK